MKTGFIENLGNHLKIPDENLNITNKDQAMQ
jgi:hypothetical protein